VTRGRILALRPLDEPACDRGRSGLGRASLERLDVSQAQCLQAWQIEAADGTREIAERVRSLVSVLRGVGELAGTDGIQNDHAGSRHAAILSRDVITVLGLIGIAAFCAAVIALAAGVTWVVVKVLPSKPSKPVQPTASTDN
jgi:hypothetical protein